MPFTVNYAVYGALPSNNPDKAAGFDVTSQLSTVLNAPGATGVVVCGNNLKGDPAPNNQKHFGALVNGRYFACQEGQTIDFNHGGGTTNDSDFVVRFAVYGALPGGQQSNAQAFDVTERVQALLDGGSDSVACNDTTFGDPSPGSRKHFAAVVNRGGGADWYFACAEGQSIDFRYGGGPL